MVLKPGWLLREPGLLLCPQLGHLDQASALPSELGTCLQLRELPDHCWLCRASRQLVRKLN